MTMNSPRRFRGLGTVACALTLLAGGYFVAQAGAKAAMKAPPSAPVIAVIDLEETLKQLKERADKEDALKVQVGELQNRIKVLEEDAKSYQSKIENAVGDPEKIRLAKEFREKAIRAEFEKQYAQRFLNELQSEMLRELYLKIDAAADAIAKKNGYALVLASDEKVNIPSGDSEAVTRAIGLKRMMYVDPQLDITREVVDEMNNKYQSGAKAR